jgi:predicted TIM-barrel fold metal-dependent hydrolase
VPAGPAADVLRELALVDAHCHALLPRVAGPDEFERCLTEGNRAPAWDTPVGLAVRRWCAPALDLPPLTPAADYLARRAALGDDEVTVRLMGAARLSLLLVDTGIGRPDLTGLGRAAGATTAEVVRLERVAEELEVVGAARFASAYVDALAVAARDAVAVKSVVAYRYGLDLDPARPTAAEVREAAGEWRAGGRSRLDHPVLLRFVLWAGVDLGLPVQLHAGFGDRDLALGRADPALLQPLLSALEPAGVPVVLLHCYPYHRQAGWLAAVYPHVYLDVGLTVGQVGGRAGAVLGECLELAPFDKLQFSTDGYRLPELYLVGAAQFRHSLGGVLDGWVADGALSDEDAQRVARMIGGDNARRIYARSAAVNHS